MARRFRPPRAAYSSANPPPAQNPAMPTRPGSTPGCFASQSWNARISRYGRPVPTLPSPWKNRAMHRGAQPAPTRSGASATYPLSANREAMRRMSSLRPMASWTTMTAGERVAGAASCGAGPRPDRRPVRRPVRARFREEGGQGPAGAGIEGEVATIAHACRVAGPRPGTVAIVPRKRNNHGGTGAGSGANVADRSAWLERPPSGKAGRGPAARTPPTVRRPGHEPSGCRTGRGPAAACLDRPGDGRPAGPPGSRTGAAPPARPRAVRQPSENAIARTRP